MGIGFLIFCKFYWRSLFAVLYPIVLVPIFACNNTPAMRCMYCVLLMGGLWVTEALPLPVTSLIPMVLFPLMGILDSIKTSLCYFKEANMMFVAGFFIALTLEYCNLHHRISLYIIEWVGCSSRRLNLGLATVTMFLSMWISNTAGTAMMIPIIEATLEELESEGIIQIYEEITVEGVDESVAWEQRRPTNTTMCYYLSIAYSASIGGMGTIVGTGTNIAFKGIYETEYPEGPGIDFGQWMLLMVPIMLVINYLVWIWLQIWFMGLFRPNSKDALAIQVGPEGEAIVRSVIRQKLNSLGKMTFHEKAVGVLFIVSVTLLCTRKPQFIRGWSEYFTDMEVKDASAALIIMMIFFIIPARPDFIYMFSDDENKQPKGPSTPLITWEYIQENMPWGLIFLLGGGFAIADGSKESGMSQLVANYLKGISDLPDFQITALTCFLSAGMSQVSTNTAVATIILPVLSDMAKFAEKHPLTLMLPSAIACSFAYCLPAATPPNALVVEPCNLPTLEMIKGGLGAVVISMVVTWTIVPYLAPVVFDTHGFPDWAKKP